MNKLMLIISYLLFTAGISLGQWPTFSAHTLSSSLTKAAATDIADFNNDGLNDIVAGTSDQAGEISLWINDGEQGFTKNIIQSEFQGARHLKAVDLNNDSNIDIVSASYYSNQIIWLKNDGEGNFEKIILVEDFANPHTVDIKDVNKDGYLDIMCCGAGLDGSTKEVAWWKNDGDQKFEKHLLTDKFKKSCFIEGIDINKDGSLDILVSDEDSGEIVWFMNDGNENFTEQAIDLNYTRAHTVFARDIDLDGDIDIIGTATSVSNLSWWENDGNQNFTRHKIGSPLGAIWADIIDMDSDGDMDIYCAAMGDQSISLWKNDGSQHFSKQIIPGTCQGGFGVIAGDIDGDGDTDFSAVGYSSNKLVWYENNLVTGIGLENNHIPEKFILHQNYPNPFNPSTIIRYSLPVRQAGISGSTESYSVRHVNIKVFDILGNEVTTLVNKNQPAGSYEVTFNGDNLTSGVYLYQLSYADISDKGNNYSEVKKMMLLK